ISTWRWSCHAVTTQKADLLHGFAAAYLESGHTSYGSDHTLLYIGTDRYSSGSNSAISMWILQHPIGVKTDGTFIDKSDKTNTTLESHKDGDLLLQASLGNSPTVDADKRVGGALQGPVTLTSTQLTQAINSVAIDVPCAVKDSDGPNKPLVL